MSERPPDDPKDESPVDETGAEAEKPGAVVKWKVWLVSALILAVLVPGMYVGVRVYDWIEGGHAPPEEAPRRVADEVANKVAPDRVASDRATSDKQAQAVAAMSARMGVIETRLQRLEDAVETMSRATRPDLAAQAVTWVAAVKKHWGEPGDRRFALAGLRAAVVLVEQTRAPHLRPALVDLRRMVAGLEESESATRRALEEAGDVIAWVDAQARTAAQEEGRGAAEEDVSMWDRGAERVKDALANAFRVRRTEDAEVREWEALIVRRALIVAQAALLDHDVESWEAALRHAHTAAQRLPGDTLSAKVAALTRIEVRLPASRDGDKPPDAVLTEIIKALRASS